MKVRELTMIKAGMIVRYAPDLCSPGEEKYLHVVIESQLNPVTGKMTRWLIRTINTKLFLQPTSVVEDYMIEPTGMTVDDLEKEAEN